MLGLEELWHGEAFSRFLGEAAWRLAPDLERVSADSAYPSRLPRSQWIRRRLGGKGRLSHVGILGSAVMSGFVALHMTWGAANELSTLTSYHRLIAKTRHPELINVLNAIIKDERRHFAFYRAQARLRLGRSAAARQITRWAMDHLWAIVGTGVRPQAETDFVWWSCSVTARPPSGARDGPHDRRAARDERVRDLPPGPDPGGGARRSDPPSGARHVGGRRGVALSAAGPSSPRACP